MDRESPFPTQDFEGMVFELWQSLDACLYHPEWCGFMRTPLQCTWLEASYQVVREAKLT
jgi:hypothetical protein